MGTISLGDKVQGRGVATGALYEGILIASASSRWNPRIHITKVLQAAPGANSPGENVSITNMRKAENSMIYSKNLIGPKPEPVQEPKFVAPFRSDGSSVIDANGRVVFKVQTGGHKVGAFAETLPMAERYELARVVAQLLTEKFASKAEDSKSPF